MGGALVQLQLAGGNVTLSFTHDSEKKGYRRREEGKVTKKETDSLPMVEDWPARKANRMSAIVLTAFSLYSGQYTILALIDL